MRTVRLSGAALSDHLSRLYAHRPVAVEDGVATFHHVDVDGAWIIVPAGGRWPRTVRAGLSIPALNELLDDARYQADIEAESDMPGHAAVAAMWRRVIVRLEAEL